MSEFDAIGTIHSFAEAYLYVCVTPCRSCGTGRLVTDTAGLQHDGDQRVLTVPVTCRACGRSAVFQFDTGRLGPGESTLEGFAELGAPAGSQTVPAINPTERPSRVIDVAGWLTLFAMLQDEARPSEDETRTARDRATVRRLQIQASACLGEALKFYDADNDLPPEDAFFSKRSRRQFRQHPELFARDRLIGLRAKLPIQHGKR
jgi:hypothetical protein